MFRLVVCFFGVVLCGFAVTPLAAQLTNPHNLQANVVVLEVFVRGDLPASKQAIDYATRLQQRTPGLRVQIHDVEKDRSQLVRLYELTKKTGRDKPVVPAFYSCRRMYFGFVDSIATGPRIEDLFTVDVYTRATCPKCDTAKIFIQDLQKRWPAIRFRIFEVSQDVAARNRWQTLCQAAGGVPGLPTFDFAGEVIIGYQDHETTGRKLETLIKNASGSSPVAGEPLGRMDSKRFNHGLSPVAFPHPLAFAVPFAGQLPFAGHATLLFQDLLSQDASFDDLLLPDEAEEADVGSETLEMEQSVRDEIDVPLLGRLRASELGMPLFTILIGLIDGFNPCAMWVLVFLLSVLVNIKDRRKIILIAGTFVVVSGLAYFAFMVAWLNLFMLIGIARPIQITLGAFAIFIGIVNVKDFFAFKKGVSLSIPESAKPGLYKRVRQIVDAKYLGVAITGAIALAVIVNVVELLCTAGLPALYTQILMLQEFPAWKNYSYLALYITAYMFDDALLVGIIVATLSRKRLQEREGRWLKLISGLVILLLGVVMIVRPAWLQLGSE